MTDEHIEQVGDPAERAVAEFLAPELGTLRMTRPVGQITARGNVLRRRRATLSVAAAVVVLGALGSSGALMLQSPAPERIVPVTSGSASATPGRTASPARSATPASGASSSFPATSGTTTAATTETTGSTSTSTTSTSLSTN